MDCFTEVGQADDGEGVLRAVYSVNGINLHSAEGLLHQQMHIQRRNNMCAHYLGRCVV